MKKIITFLTQDVWKIPLHGVSKLKAFWIRMLRISLITRQIFVRYQLQQGASALTYYTLLASVPMLVILLGVTRGFMQESLIVDFLMERFRNQKEAITQLISFADMALAELKKGLIAIVGILILIWSAIKILKHLEISLNNIWNVKKGRPLMRQFSDYLAMILFSPLLFIVANGVIFYLSAKLSSFEHAGGVVEKIDPFLFFLYNLLPYFLTSFLFTFIYIFMPNTKVEFKPALYAGLIAGALYQIVQWIYLGFQIGVTRYNAIYGTFAAVPLFLIWVHLSWVILLLGGKIAYAFQNVDAYEFITEDFSLSHRFRMILSLLIAHFCIRKFQEEKKAPTAIEISRTLSIPLVITKQLLSHLVEGHVLIEVKSDGDEGGYQPAVSLHKLTIKKIMDMIEEHGGIIPLPSSSEVEKILKTLSNFSQMLEKADANQPLSEL